MEYDVTIDREQYIGGSDIPAIMGISKFKTRWDLLQEKAGLKENTFTGNRYTEYGKVMEPKIREYINNKYTIVPFEPNRVIRGDFRAHTDGYNGGCVLEIKTTSQIFEDVKGYRAYLVQLLKYMEVNDVRFGHLAVYERPEDFSTEFDPERLHEYPIALTEFEDLLELINAELDSFREDLITLKANPLLSEQDFLKVDCNQLLVLSRQILAFEHQLGGMKLIENKLKEAKQQLFAEMEKYDVKSWTTPNGTKITRVDATPEKVETVTEFDEDTFKEENPNLYDMYLRETEKKKAGRSGYVKITLPKG